MSMQNLPKIAKSICRGSIAGASVLIMASAAGGQTPQPADIVKMRQAQFREIGTAFKAINDELKKDAPVKYVLGSSANQIVTDLRDIHSMFPSGSGAGPGIKSSARPEIWSNHAEFERVYSAAATEAAKLASISRSGDLTAVRAQVKALGSACSACHTDFRMRD